MVCSELFALSVLIAAQFKPPSKLLDNTRFTNIVCHQLYFYRAIKTGKTRSVKITVYVQKIDLTVIKIDDMYAYEGRFKKAGNFFLDFDIVRRKHAT